jgi:hypothetical protein
MNNMTRISSGIIERPKQDTLRMIKEQLGLRFQTGRLLVDAYTIGAAERPGE